MENVVVLPGEKFLIKDLSPQFNFKNLDTAFNSSNFENNIKNKISKDLFILDTFSNLNELKIICEEESTNFLKKNYYDSFDNLIITSSWFNNTSKGQKHHKHQHPFSVISGIIFLDNNPENMNLNFYKKSVSVPYTEIGGVDCLSLKNIIKINNIKVNFNLKNYLILFLSNIFHDVSEVQDKTKNRRTLSFNTFFNGIVGDKNYPLARINYKEVY